MNPKCLIGLLGQSGSGKDTVADYILRLSNYPYNYKVALADPIKKFCQEIFDWNDSTLWGPSEYRNEPDPRYKKSDGTLLTPRFALQYLGTNLARTCYEDVWIDYGLRKAKDWLGGSYCGYYVISDVRFINEARKIKEFGGKIWRIIRPNYNSNINQVGISNHPSEIEQLNPEIEKYIDVIIKNDGTLENLKYKVKELLNG